MGWFGGVHRAAPIVQLTWKDSIMGSDYTLHMAELQKEFDKTVNRVRGVFVARYSDPLTNTMIAEALQEHTCLILQLHDLGGIQPFTQFIISSAWFWAMYRVLQQHGFSVEDAGQSINDVSEALLKAYPVSCAACSGICASRVAI